MRPLCSPLCSPEIVRPEANGSTSGGEGLEAVLAALVDVKRAVGKIGKEGVRRLLDEAI